MTYQCPECGSTELRVECNVVLSLDGENGKMSLEDFDQLPGSVAELCNEQDYTVCNACDESGPLSDFNPRNIVPTPENIYGLPSIQQSIEEDRK